MQETFANKPDNMQPRVAFDKSGCNYTLFNEIVKHLKNKNSAKLLDISPVSYLRIVKSDVEISGMEEALRLESAALISFYANLGDLL